MLFGMDLRDRFAAHFAAALVDAFSDEHAVARRAYELAEAMLAERARRIDAEEEGAILLEPRRPSMAAPADAHEQAPASEPSEPSEPSESPAHHGALLDEPAPMFEPELVYDDEDIDPRLLEPPYDPSWDLEAHVFVTGAGVDSPRPGPGLVRTQPEDEARKKERSA